jgi:hypothetical protein
MPENKTGKPLPELDGDPIDIRYEKGLLDAAGNPAQAETSIRHRVIVLDQELKSAGPERARVVVHELFHFVWVRLGNPARHEWEALMRAEFAGGAKGEAGWSSEWRKRELRPEDLEVRNRYWREYCCESFCDTASLIFTGLDDETTLKSRWLRKRQAWFAGNIESRKLAL